MMLHKLIKKVSLTQSNMVKYFCNIQVKDINQQREVDQKLEKYYLGIHLGNTNLYSAKKRYDTPFKIPNSENQNGILSYVSFLNDGNSLDGQSIKDLIQMKINSTFYGAKRFIGMKFDDPIILQNSEKLPKNIVRNQNGDVCFQFDNQILTPEQVCQKFISQLKQIADSNCESKLITVPDYYNDKQREIFLELVQDLNIRGLRNQSTSVLYANDHLNQQNNRLIAIYHLGGYTFNISIIHFEDGFYDIKETQSDIFSGGEEINNLLSEYIAKQILSQTGIDITRCESAIQNLRDVTEKAKCELSQNDIANINLEYFLPNSIERRCFSCSITRLQFEEICQEFLENTIRLCEKCLKDSGFSKDNIDKVILTGGSTRIPLVQKLVSEYFGKQIYQNNLQFDGDKAMGNAILSETFSQLFKNKNFFIPFNLGIEIAGGCVYWMVERSMKLPIKVSQVFSTNIDNQTSVSIKIILGVNPQANQNKLLYKINLTDIKPLPKGVPEIKITLTIKDKDILVVNVKDMNSLKEQEAIIESYSNVNQEELEKINEHYFNQIDRF
ncbi:molecular chaperone DnaK (macronuclear) [Tetrahymena thermophila SB210]|uniref:Molecular chaperone DnaK n=1 Tax=Tetrahymena thermophila (strain SB210) TaxID=312017 RepID=Q22E65_TETTS|nr:molecular chaperone DnaK [Tetrahymena thermophila SB210]EAR83549.2 molecular chaperone DnaK [Tetrahymena thermophila SB210]|eukprot:XP_001031212.2 molecular chaperone DnaK [Tetrahymena thermophila SB210]